MADPIVPSAPAAAPTAEAQASEAVDNSTETPIESQEEVGGEEAEAKDSSKEEKKETAASKKTKRLKLKIDSKEAFEDLPFEIDEADQKTIDYLTRQLQMAKMGQKRASEASEYKKQLDKVGAYLEEIKQNPKKVRELMKDLSIDERELAASILEEELERSKKSPEQLEKERLETELQKMKDERDKEKKDFETREFERLQEQAFNNYDTQISSALEKSDLPKSPYVVKKIADYMLLGLQNGLDVSPEDVLPLVREEVQGDIRQMFSAMPEDVIENLVGKDNLKRIRKKSIEKSKEVPVPVSKTVKDTAANVKKEVAPVKKQSFKNYFKM